MGSVSEPSQPSFTSFSSESPTFHESDSPGQAGSSHFPSCGNGFGASFSVLPSFAVLWGFWLLSGVLMRLLVPLLRLFFSYLVSPFRFMLSRGSSRHRRKRIRGSGSQAASRRGAKSRRLASLPRFLFVLRLWRAHNGFWCTSWGVFYASPTRLRSALRHCTATTFCASPSLILLRAEGPVAYLPPGACPGLSLCLLLVQFSCFVPVLGSPRPWFCCLGRHSCAPCESSFSARTWLRRPGGLSLCSCPQPLWSCCAL